MTPDGSLEVGARRILGRSLTDTEASRTRKYLKILEKWQRKRRLVGSTEHEWMVIHLVLDSWAYLRILPSYVRQASDDKGKIEILDFGSGAGIPGVPLAIVLSEANFTLLEGRERRVSFLSEVVRELGLRNCTVFHGRAESAADLYERYDAVVMRCAGEPADVVPQALRFTRPYAPVILSGPPKPKPTPLGEWVEVEVPLGEAERRNFLVAKRGAT